MDKSCHSSGESTVTAAPTTSSSSSSSSSSNRDQYLRHLNRISHNISKPVRRPNNFDPHVQAHHHHHHPQPHPQPQLQTQPGLTGQPQPPPQQHQPPVYNINKSDFRDVVQKLTGSPAHERFSTPPPIHPPKPPSSRLQKIRPPPLAQISNRPPPLLNCAAPLPPPPQQPPPSHQPSPNAASANPIRQLSNLNPLSPLPPFPAVHAAAESPISAYMRYLQTTISAAADSDPKRFSGFSPLAPLVSPRWTNLSPIHQPSNPPQNHQIPVPPPQILPPSQYPMPTSPLAFGCIPSPKSPYALLSPSLFLSPTAGQLGFQQFPLSPTFAVTSPRW
ncbi:VQ protein [Dillenia turbinata]|uniref:VQ protein n=1 Tax=Dillenia turbinata TaxID=194707 RepID=A0AAN8ZER9_9MAGN